MTLAFVFPGQGSQFVGMGQALADADTVARDVFAEVDDALGLHLSKIIWEGPEDALTLTENTQPALMAVSVAVARVLAKNGAGIADKAAYVAGHSLGEYSALAAAGSLSLADTARLLKIRGQAMQAAVPVGEGAMAAILGLDIETAREVAVLASAGGEVCVAANDNADGQIVLSGHKAAVENAITLAKDKGAKRGVLLNVSAPFHSPLMAPAAEKMREALADVQILEPVVPLIANVSAAPTQDPERIRAQLVEQVTGSVRWRESVVALAGLGVTGTVELGAGKVLSGLTRRINRDLTAASVETPEQIEEFLKSI